MELVLISIEKTIKTEDKLNKANCEFMIDQYIF